MKTKLPLSPPEVATAILAEPKARLTNTERKRLRFSRYQCHDTGLPIVRLRDGTYGTRYPSTPRDPLRKLTWEQLYQRSRRLARRTETALKKEQEDLAAVLAFMLGKMISEVRRREESIERVQNAHLFFRTQRPVSHRKRKLVLAEARKS